MGRIVLPPENYLPYVPREISSLCLAFNGPRIELCDDIESDRVHDTILRHALADNCD
jgi:hypothetical protein